MPEVEPRDCECLDPFHGGQPCRNLANADEVFGGGKTVSYPALCAACAWGCDEFNGPQNVANVDHRLAPYIRPGSNKPTESG
jgi:hypothetical protein